MKIRYCDTPLQALMPCDVGWGDYTEGVTSCGNEPMEKNCRLIVDADKLYCPYCVGKVKMEEVDGKS